VSYIVPWAAGGGTDTISRAMASVLSSYLGQSVNVINRTGGGGVVGHLSLAQSAPEGHTIGAITVELTMMHHMGLTDLVPDSYTPLAMLANNPAAVTVRADAPWNTVGELLDDVRANPGEYRASGTSRGGIWDLARIGMLMAAGLDADAMPWIPSQGAAPAFQELLAGGVDVITAALVEAGPLMNAGQVRVLGVMSDERLEAFPGVPTLKEQGLDWKTSSWIGVGGPAGMDDDVRDVLSSAIEEAAADSQYVQALERAGYNLQFLAHDEFGRFMAEQDSLNGALLRSAGIAR
jgi:tripartite-type tricarboxylate transporter receptor subunit TctC